MTTRSAPIDARTSRWRARARRAASAHQRLRAEDVRVHFEGVRAVDGVDLALERGEILGLIGPNGAGKTTMVNALSGFQKPTAGRVFLDDHEITGLSPNRLGHLGLARTFQAVRLFDNLTAFENVELGALGTGMHRRDARALAWQLLERMHMAERAHQAAASLPYGDERKLGIIRALATRPSFLLLDEPAAGMNEGESEELMHTIAGIRDDFGCGVLVIEHDMPLIMRLCERIQVLDYGKTICVGTPAEVQRDPAVILAYLGSSATRNQDGEAEPAAGGDDAQR